MATDPVVPSSSRVEADEVDFADAAKRIRVEDHGLAGRLTRALVTLPGLRVVLVSMLAGSSWKEHSTQGRTTVQPLTGHIQMHFSDREFDLHPGELAAFGADIPHDVFAKEDTVFLLTVALPNLD